MSKIEIELKYHIDNPGKIEGKLRELNAEFKTEFSGVDTYFVVLNNPGGKRYLRVREQDGKAEINYHYAESESHTRQWEVGVTNSNMAKEIFKQLGYKVDVEIEKKRKIYGFLNSEIVLDQVKNLGSFVEVESPSKKELLKIVKILNLSENQRVKSSGYSDLLRKRNGRVKVSKIRADSLKDKKGKPSIEKM